MQYGALRGVLCFFIVVIDVVGVSWFCIGIFHIRIVPSVDEEASSRFLLQLLKDSAITASSGQWLWSSGGSGGSPSRTSQTRIFPSEHPEASSRLSLENSKHRTRQQESLETSFRGQGGYWTFWFFHQVACSILRALRQSSKHELYVVRSKNGTMWSRRISRGT